MYHIMWGGSLTRYRPPPLPPQDGRGLKRDLLFDVGGPILSNFAKAGAKAMGQGIKENLKRKALPILATVAKRKATSVGKRVGTSLTKKGAKRLRDVLGV